MRRRKYKARGLAVVTSLAVTLTSTFGGFYGGVTAQAGEVLGSLSEEIVGTYSYTVDGVKYTKTNASLAENLPSIDKKNSYRYTTDNYDANNGAFDTSNWATSFMWDLDKDNPYSSTVYAIPLAIRAGIDGGAKNVIQVTAPSSLADVANSTYTMQMPANGSCTDFFIKTPFSTSSAKVDAVTDWSYDVVMENSSNSSNYMKMTMLQGSVFVYFQMVGSKSLTIERGKTGLASSVIYTSDDGKAIIVRCYDNADEDYDYYAFYGASGTTYEATSNGNMLSNIAVNFGGTGSYMSMAYLGSAKKSPNDNWAVKMCQAYEPYAYNYVTDTRAEYSYNSANSTVTTTYTYTVEKKAESKAEGTIIGVLPHQYKNIAQGTSFLPYTYQTIRGVMKTIAGSSFTTEVMYSGVLPFMPDYSDSSSEDAALSAYLTEYIEEFSENYFKNYEGSGDTYWDGKGLNRLGNAIAAAEAAEDSRSTELLSKLKERLIDWFTYSGTNDDAYFYYDEGVGSLFGFPQSYDSVNQINDHHFHYGYFIYAAAQVAMRDPSFAEQYGNIVNELIYDIACPVRNSADSKYPYLRNFAPYEGHSWASGHANFDMGNNQESSSEAINAWAGIILWGEATGNTQLRDLGIYLYSTEVSAIEAYWYDVDQDVLTDAYRYNKSIKEAESIDKTNASIVNLNAAIVWGGSYTYATWFSANPYFIQGINLLPMNPSCFYLAGNPEYIALNKQLATTKATAGGWAREWIEIWAEYAAMGDPATALANWKADEAAGYGVEGGETKAHAYHFISTLNTYGTPDVSIGSDTALSSVFDKNGEKTYVVYNPSSSSKKVTFTDGVEITAAANQMTVATSANLAEQVANYTVNYYKENNEGGWTKDSKIMKGMIGKSISITPDSISGYTYDSTNSKNKLTGTITADGQMNINIYYKRNIYQITYELNGGTNSGSAAASYTYGSETALPIPSRAGYEFDGWYLDRAYSTAISVISAEQTGNITLYAKWTDPYRNETETGKYVVFDGTKLTFTVESKNAKKVLLFYGFKDSKAEADAITSDAGVGGLAGYTMEQDGNVFTYEVADVTAQKGKYLVYIFNLEYDGTAEKSAWGVYYIPTGNVEVAYYTENYYIPQSTGGYQLYSSNLVKSVKGSAVTITEKNISGYSVDTSVAETVTSGTVKDDNSLVLKLYYKKNAQTETGGSGEDGKDEGDNNSGSGNQNPVKPGVSVRGDKGVEKNEAGEVVIYVKANTANVVFCTVVDSKAAADAITSIGSQTPGYNLTVEKDGYMEFNLGKVSDGKYVVYAFNNGVQETPIAIEASQIPSVVMEEDSEQESESGSESESESESESGSESESESESESGSESESESESGSQSGSESESESESGTGDTSEVESSENSSEETGDGEDDKKEPVFQGRGKQIKDGKITFYVADVAQNAGKVSVKYKVFASKTEALEAAEKGDLSSFNSSIMEYDTDSQSWQATVASTMNSQKYLVYGFDIPGEVMNQLKVSNSMDEEEVVDITESKDEDSETNPGGEDKEDTPGDNNQDSSEGAGEQGSEETPADSEQGSEEKPSDSEQGSEEKPSDSEQGSEEKPTDSEQGSEEKPTDSEQGSEEKPSDSEQTGEKEEGDGQQSGGNNPTDNSQSGAGNTVTVGQASVKDIALSSQGIKITWTPVANAIGYQIYRRVDGGSWKEQDFVLRKTSYTDGKAKGNGAIYEYAVAAVRDVNGTMYTGEKSSTVKYVYLTTPKISKLKRAGVKKLSLQLSKKNTKAKGYEIYYSLKSNFKQKKSVKITSGKTIKKTLQKLKSGKKYYVKVRAYTKVDGKTYYSNWSAKKSAKVK